MIKQLPKIESSHILLFVAVVVGFALRIYGIKWGLPDESHPQYSFHPDEVLHILFARLLADGIPIEKQFIYGGTFYFTIVNAYFFLADRLAGFLGGENYFANTILIGRLFHTAIAILTILIVYQCGRVLYGRIAGGLSAIMLAVMPAHIICAQRLRPDEFGAFFVALILLLSCWILSAEQRARIKIYIFAGISLGAAVAFRFPLAILTVLPFIAHVFVSKGMNSMTIMKSLQDRRLVVLLGAVLIGYALFSPYTFIYPEWFVRGMQVQWAYQSSIFVDAVGNGSGLYQWGWIMMHEALGYPLYFLALGGIIIALVKRSQADIIILAAGMPYFILTTFTSWVVVRYTVPLLPLLAILAGRFVAYTIEEISRFKTVALSVLVTALGLTLLANYAYLKMEAGRDVREVTTEWIQHNIPQRSSIVLLREYVEDEFFNPVIPKEYNAFSYPFAAGFDSREFFLKYKFDYLILHEFIYKNMERLGPVHPHLHVRVFHELLLKSHYKPIKEFRQPIEALGIDFSSWFTSQDYVIANPGIRIYKYQN